jgi:hypothetical protein
METHPYFYITRDGERKGLRAAHVYRYVASRGCYATLVYIWTRPQNPYTRANADTVMTEDRWTKLREAKRIVTGPQELKNA